MESAIRDHLLWANVANQEIEHALKVKPCPTDPCFSVKMRCYCFKCIINFLPENAPVRVAICDSIFFHAFNLMDGRSLRFFSLCLLDDVGIQLEKHISLCFLKCALIHCLTMFMF